MRPAKAVLLTKPFELLLATCLLVLGLVFTVFPESLDHAPIGFETRGIIHHVWHYSLIAGAAMTVFGLLWDNARYALRVEFVGLVVLWVVLAENMLAVITARDSISGLPMAFRVAILSFIVVRCYGLLAQPVIYVVRGTKHE